MDRVGVIALAVFCLGFWSCDKAPWEPDDRVRGPKTTESLQVTDIQPRAGRSFVYLDSHGQIHRTKDYGSIPLERRGAVIVQEGAQRSRVRQAQGGQIRIEALPPIISQAVDAGPAKPSQVASDPNAEKFRAMLKKELKLMEKAQTAGK